MSAQARLEAVARAIDALRAGRAVRLKTSGVHTLFAVETISAAALTRLVRPLLILSHARARTLKIRLYTPDVVALTIRPGTSPADLKAIADPTADLETPLKGPFAARRQRLAPAYGAAVKLAKLAGLLPAAVVVTPDLEPNPVTATSLGL